MIDAIVITLLICVGYVAGIILFTCAGYVDTKVEFDRDQYNIEVRNCIIENKELPDPDTVCRALLKNKEDK